MLTCLYFGLMHFLCCLLCFAEHSEDKQLPVHPAAGNSSGVCHHPQLTPSGPGLLRHAHLLQPCWWVLASLPPQTASSRLSRDCLHRTLSVPALFSAAHGVVADMWVISHCVWLPLFLQSSPWAAQRSLPYRASALPGSRWAPCRHGNSINWARQLLILWCE